MLQAIQPIQLPVETHPEHAWFALIRKHPQPAGLQRRGGVFCHLSRERHPQQLRLRRLHLPKKMQGDVRAAGGGPADWPFLLGQAGADPIDPLDNRLR